jgi:hypothetical protein
MTPPASVLSVLSLDSFDVERQKSGLLQLIKMSLTSFGLSLSDEPTSQMPLQEFILSYTLSQFLGVKVSRTNVGEIKIISRHSMPPPIEDIVRVSG